jgi:hypothetical protein
MKDTFELEQAIMNCWHVVDDIKTVTNHAERLSKDDLLNALIGLSTVYQMKFEDLFAQFEQYTTDNATSIL